MKLIAEASLQILKPVDVVFDGIIDKNKLCKYFIGESSGNLIQGKNVFWKFPEFDERFEISQVKIVKHQSISFVWDPQTVVNIDLEPFANNSCVVKVTENGKTLNEENMKWFVSNVAGWSNFLACMKAFLEYGIELRRGAYDFMKMEN